jgi:hypothetical protein
MISDFFSSMLKGKVLFNLIFFLLIIPNYTRDSLNELEVPSKENLQAVIYATYENPMHVYVRFDNYNLGDIIEVTIKNSKNKILYKQCVQASKYNRKFNMDIFPDGAYLIKVSSRTTTYSQQIDIRTVGGQKLKRVTQFRKPC